MNSRDMIADLRAENERLRERILDLETDIQRAYIALTKAHMCDGG